MAARFRSLARRSVAWVLPSAIAACGAAIALGAIDGYGESPGELAAAVGFVGLVAVPLFFVLSLVLRGLWLAWRPRVLLATIRDERGRAPTLGAWMVCIALGLGALAAVTFASVRVLAAHTSFNPLVVSFVEAAVATATAACLVVAIVPLHRLVTAGFRRLDVRPGATAIAILATIVVATSVAGYLVKQQLGPLSLEPLVALGVAVAVGIALHAIWTRAPGWLGVPVILAALACCGLAIRTRATDPSRTISLWSDHALSGLVIEHLFDLDDIRSELPSTEFAPTPRPGARHPDILLVTIDTVRADHTPPYGGAAQMPVLAALAERGRVFEWAFSPSNVTRRSIPSMITGLAPDRVRGRVVGWALHLDPRHVLVAERLRAAGYETAGFMCCDSFWGPDAHTGLSRGLDHVETEHAGLRLAQRANAWLADREHRPHSRPLFLWVHILEPHNWTDGQGTPTSDADRTRFYDRTVGSTDQMLGLILAPFDHRAADEAPIVVVTADHGEGLGDHGQPFHSTDLYNSQTHVPFVIAGPGIAPGRIAETVSLTDLTPTLVALAGFDLAKGVALDGRALDRLVLGREAANPDGGTAYAAMIKDRSNPGGLEAIVDGRWKLIRSPSRVELYDTRGDPQEAIDVSVQHADLVARLTALLDQRGRLPPPFAIH